MEFTKAEIGTICCMSDFPIVLRTMKMPNGQTKTLSQEEPMLWRVTIWTVDDQDWDRKEFVEQTNATEVYELVTDIDDLHKW